ncbi:MAG: alpha/beta fold hydrolase [Bdellovibrionales bacterium]|nr:alpha/beta fold hydrolase [Bdellovibrionales bacterium]
MKRNAPILVTPTKAPRAAVLAIPGLNNSRRIWTDLAHDLASRHLMLFSLELRRKEQPPTRLGAAWIDEVNRATVELRQCYPDLPLYHLGYSLGAAVSLCATAHRPDLFQRLVLLAPALTFRKTSSLVRVLLPLARLRIALPSVAAAEFREGPWCSLHQYRALFATAQQAVLQLPQVRSPTTILIHQRDELLDAAALKRLVDRSMNSALSIELLTGDEPWGERPSYQAPRHMLFSRSDQSPRSWKHLIDQICIALEC